MVYTSESSIERKLKREIDRLGGKALKFTSPGMAGVPDRIVLLPGGQVFFVELKAPGQKMRPLQLKRQRELEALGFTVKCLDRIEAVDEFIREVVG